MSGFRFFIAIIVLVVVGGMQVPVPNQLTYADAYKLKWTDFTGSIPANSPLTAASHCGISMDMTSQENKMLFTVICFFKKDKSWVLERGKANAPLLKHEQGHWDIYELHARKFRQSLAGLKMKLNDIAKALPDMYNKAMADCKAENDKYDKETNHSIDVSVQNKWNSSIEARLKVSAAWKDSKVTVIPIP